MKQESSNTAASGLGLLSPAMMWILGLVAISWSLMVLASSSRVYFIMNYGVMETVSVPLEPFAASNSAVLFSVFMLGIWLTWFWFNATALAKSQHAAIAYLAISLLPLVIWLGRGIGIYPFPAQFWESLWIAGWTGLSFGELARVHVGVRRSLENYTWAPSLLILLATMACTVWWFGQSVKLHRNFMLGFNDFGHFLQRVANTAEGRGFLLESPVLPPFWDHFNPGLLAVLPLWKVFPRVELVFALQAIALSLPGLVVYAISRHLGHSCWAAGAFGLAWLAQPAVGQMNLAYSYGWHPITFAIPLLLIALWCLLTGKRIASGFFTLSAMSMEESVFVVIAMFAASSAMMPQINRWLNRGAEFVEPAENPELSLSATLSRAIWWAVAVISLMAFLLVYKLSGLAEFQTGRFVALGNSPSEILMSPVLRPRVFWGQFAQVNNLFLIALLWLPCGLPSLLRGWRYVLPTLLPLGVLIVWDHAPAKCLAFQYPSTLLPFFWLACLTGSARTALPSAVTALVTGLMLSLFVGQLPFSSITTRDIEVATYGNEPSLRDSSTASGRWLLEQVAAIRATGDECLATGRIAAHLVGNRDVETVSQYLQRRDQLAALPDRDGKPIQKYQCIILDLRESFQQSRAQIDAVANEARSNDFAVVDFQHDIVIMKR